MKDHTNVYDEIRTQSVVECVPQLIAEWNLNRYFDVSKIDNNPTEKSMGFDRELFPIETLIESNRPGKGIVKARVGEGRISNDYEHKPTTSRYYVASPGDDYKYWTSPIPSEAVDNGSGYFLDSHVHITTEYESKMPTNKIVIGAETSLGAPAKISLGIRRGGSTWDWIFPNGPIDFGVDENGFGLPNHDGRVVFYYDGTDWVLSTEEGAAEAAQNMNTACDEINGIKLVVSHMTRPLTYCSLIEISPRLEKDLSGYLMSVDDNFEISDASSLTPFGKASSNTANLSLWNPLIEDSTGDEAYNFTGSEGLLFNNANPNSLFYRIIDTNVKFNLSYIYHFQGGGSSNPVEQFEMWGSEWGGQTEEEVSIELQDYSKFLMEDSPRQIMWQNITLAEIVWRLCDAAGFNKYQVEIHDLDSPRKVPIYWTDGEQTYWEIFAELTEATQFAVFFDSYGVLQVQSKSTAFNLAKTEAPDWELKAQDSGANKADIITLEKTSLNEVNHVTVNYIETEFSEYNRGFPKMETVWEPEGTVTLRATPLRRQLDRTDPFIWIEASEAAHWPFESMVNIQGELIKYEGKQYVWYEDANTKHKTIINNEDELQDVLNKSGPAAKRKNHFTGLLKITQRGMWNTENKRHFVEARGYSVHRIKDGDRKTNQKGFHHRKKDSIIRMQGIKKSSASTWLLATRGEPDDAGYFHYGTSIRWPKSSGKHGWAGLVFHNNSGPDEDGYYVELRPSKYVTPKTRNSQYECCFYVMNGGNRKKIAENQNRGQPLNIPANLWVEVDVQFQIVGEDNDHRITVSINGKEAFVSVVKGSDRIAFGGKFGLFVRGSSRAEFEYLYALGRDERPSGDNLSFLDKVSGGYIGRQFEREWVWRTRKDSRRTKRDQDRDKERFAAMFIDEFGPYVHEVRHYNVPFEPAPVLHSNLYSSNDYQIVCPEYTADAFGANFYIANAHRTNAIANGDDTLQYARAQQTVNQKLMIFGRNVIVKEAQNIVVKDEDAIRRRGKIEVEINSPWIQSEGHAKSIGEWIKNHWGTPQDEVSVNIFGNPLIELGDVVSVNYPLQDMAVGTHKYFVVGVSNNFSEGGLDTSLILRRAWTNTSVEPV